MLRVLNFMTPARLTPGKLPFLLSFSFLFCLAAPSFGQGKPTPAAVRLKGLEQRQVLEKSSALNHINFRNIGPSVMSGRVDDIEANPNDPTEFYVAMQRGDFGIPRTTVNPLRPSSIALTSSVSGISPSTGKRERSG
ncbi:MAG: hypothetical protein ACXVBT_09825 [Flavisolibacter sp.]